MIASNYAIVIVCIIFGRFHIKIENISLLHKLNIQLWRHR